MRSTFLAVVLLSFVFVGCHHGRVRGSGTAKTEQRSLPEFSAIEVSGAFKVSVRCGESPGATVTADDNLLPLIKTEVRNSKLRIYPMKDVDSRTELSITVTTPGISEFEVSGVAAADIANVQGEKLKLSISGAGSMRAEGSVQEARFVVSGAGTMSAEKLHAERVRVIMSGAGSADVYATETLDVTVSGAGNVAYYGNPKEVKKTISGVGLVSKKD
jgi:hypothetical protein